MQTSPDNKQGTIPDARFIREKIPVADVAGELGLEVIDGMVRCWRPDKHENGDRTPSVGISRKRNRVRCFVCDAREYSSIDLVKMVLGLDTRGAISWIASRFNVPNIPKGRHLRKAGSFLNVERAGLGGALEAVIRSGLWAHMTPSEKAILPVFCGLSATDELQLSYAAIRRFSGVRSDTTVSAVLTRFENVLHLLKVRRGTDGNLRACNSYRLTLDDPQLREIMDEVHNAERKEIEAEQELRRERRNRRQQERAEQLPQVAAPVQWSVNMQRTPTVEESITGNICGAVAVGGLLGNTVPSDANSP